MTKYLPIHIIFSLLFILSSSRIDAQSIEVWPGDASNNGIANHIDLLYIGVAYNQEGPIRVVSPVILQANPTFGTPPYLYNWSVNGSSLDDSTDLIEIDPFVNSEACVTITDSEGISCVSCQSNNTITASDSCFVNVDWEIGTDSLYDFVSLVSGGNAPYDYLWDFGFGTTYTTQNLTDIEFPAPGTYIVCLTVTDNLGISCQSCSNVIVGPDVSEDCSIIIGPSMGVPPFGNPDWIAQPLEVNWNGTFVNGANFGYADCNGNGIVDELDVDALEMNYGLTHGVVVNEELENDLGLGFPSFELDFSGIDTSNIIPGQTLEIPIVVGDASLPITDYYGSAFTINYDSTLVKEGSANIVFFLNSWVNPNNSLLISTQRDDYENQKLEAAISRTNQNTVSGHGPIGTFSIIIEDNIGSFLNYNPDLYLEIDKIKQVDENLDDTPVNGSSINITIDTSGLTNQHNIFTDNKIKVFPNPTINTVTIDAPFTQIETVKIYNTTGRLQKTFYQENTDLQVGDLPSGIYILKIQTTNGIASKKIIIQ